MSLRLKFGIFFLVSLSISVIISSDPVPVGIYIAILGGFMNLFVMSLNGWQMPVDVSSPDSEITEYLWSIAESSDNHCIMTESTKIKFLGDVLRFGSLSSKRFSPGDAIMFLGFFLMLLEILFHYLGIF